MLDKVYSGLSYRAVVVCSVLRNQQHILNKLSLKQKCMSNKVCINQLMELLCQESHRNLTLCLPKSNGLIFANSVFMEML